MNEHVRLAAIVPMRHESERVRGKNYRPLGGVPLFGHVVSTLLACPSVGRVVIDTDSPVIAARVARDYPGVLVLERPPHLCGGDTPMNDVLMNTVRSVDAAAYLQTHSTNPFLGVATIERAVATFCAAADRHDSLFGVTRLQQRLWDAGARPINHDPSVLMRTQDLSPIFVENSCLYLFTAASLSQRNNRIGRSPMMFEIDKREAHDIDDEADFALAELMLRSQTLTNERAA